VKQGALKKRRMLKYRLGWVLINERLHWVLIVSSIGNLKGIPEDITINRLGGEVGVGGWNVVLDIRL
jgi:hypothetical protein